MKRTTLFFLATLFIFVFSSTSCIKVKQLETQLEKTQAEFDSCKTNSAVMLAVARDSFSIVAIQAVADYKTKQDSIKIEYRNQKIAMGLDSIDLSMFPVFRDTVIYDVANIRHNIDNMNFGVWDLAHPWHYINSAFVGVDKAALLRSLKHPPILRAALQANKKHLPGLLEAWKVKSGISLAIEEWRPFLTGDLPPEKTEMFEGFFAKYGEEEYIPRSSNEWQAMEESYELAEYGDLNSEYKAWLFVNRRKDDKTLPILLEALNIVIKSL